MKGLFPKLGPDTYVKAGHFFQRDGAALLSALVAINHEVEFLVVEDPNNELLRRHAEIEVDETMAAVRDAGSQLQFTQMVQNLFSGEGARERLIEDELSRLRGILDNPGMGVFAIAGAQADVTAFMDAYLKQPGPPEQVL